MRGTVLRTNAPNSATCFQKSDRLFCCPAGRRSPTPSHQHPVTETSSRYFSIRLTHPPSPELHTDEPVLGVGLPESVRSGRALLFMPGVTISVHYSEQ